MTAGSIVIDLVMKTGMFETDTKRAEKAMANFQKRAVQMGKAVGAMVATAAGALSLMVASNIRAINSLSMLSDQIGVSTADLSNLSYAAQQMAGVTEQQFGMALRRMTRRIEEAAQGAGPAAAALERMGLSARELAKMTPDEQFRRLSDAMKDTSSQAQRLQNVMALMDTEGMPLVNMMSEGADAVREFEQEAESLGITISEELAAQVRTFEKEMGKLNGVKKGLVQTITAQLLPTLTNLTRKFTDTEGAADRLDKVARVASTGIKFLASVAAVVIGVFKTLGEALGGIAAALVSLVSGRFREAVDIAKNVGADFVGNIKGIGSDLAGIWDDTVIEGTPVTDAVVHDLETATKTVQTKGAKLVDEAAKIYARVEDAIARIGRDILTFGMSDDERMIFDLEVQGADEEQIARAERMLGVLRNLKDEEEDLRKAREQHVRESNVLGDLHLEIEALGKSAEWIATRNALLRAGVEAESEMGKQIAETVAELYRQGEAMDMQIETMDGLRDVARGFLHDLREGVGIWDSLKNAAQRFSDVLFDLASQKIIEQLFGKQGEAGGGSWGSAIGSFFSNMWGGSRASGGDGIPGRALLVGEQGPELFVPRTMGTILSADKTAAVRSGGGSGRNVSVTQNFINPTLADRRSDAQRQQEAARRLRISSARA